MCADRPTSERSSTITTTSSAPEPEPSAAAQPGEAGDGRAIPPLTTLAQKLSWLFEVVRQPTGKRYPLRAVEDWCKTHRSSSVAHGYLAQLTNGRKKNPSPEVLDALAAFFNAPRQIFSTDPDRVRSAAAIVLLAQGTRQAGIRRPSIDVTGLTQEQILDLATRRDAYRHHNTGGNSTES